MGQVEDVARCVTMDLKSPGNAVYQVGLTKNELGGSHFAKVGGLSGGEVPQVDAEAAKRTFAAMHEAISSGRVRACHDLSEGGLAVAAAEMAFAGGVGMTLSLEDVPVDFDADVDEMTIAKLFSESNSRFLCEVAPEHEEAFRACFKKAGAACAKIGTTEASETLRVVGLSSEDASPILIDAPLAALKAAWQSPLDW